jgi:hypothetical protein
MGKLIYIDSCRVNIPIGGIQKSYMTILMIRHVDPDAMDYDEFYDVNLYVGDGDVAALEAAKALTHVFVNPTQSCRKNRKWPSVQKDFARKQWEVIRNKCQVTTQYAAQETSLPLCRHFRSCFLF